MSDQAIDLLGWLPMTERLNVSLQRAFAGVGRAGETAVEIEHVLAAFLEDVDANVYLAGCGVEREKVRAFCKTVVSERAMPSAGLQPNGANGTHGANGASHFATPQPRSESFGGSDLGRDGSYFFARDAASPEPRATYSDGFDAGAPAPGPAARGRAEPSRPLRRLMARASEMAERAKQDTLGSELALQAIALDETSKAGETLRRLLPSGELARLRTAHSAARDGRQAQAEPKRKKGAELQEAAFATLSKRVEGLLFALHRELQKDMRYRIANDLSAFVTSREPNDGFRQSGALETSALPILQAARAELERDPQYMALERIRGALRSIRLEERAVSNAVAGLMRAGLLEEGAALTKTAQALISLPKVDAAETMPSPAAPVEPAEAVVEAIPVLPSPAPEPAPKATAPAETAAPILSRVLDSMRPASQMFARRRANGATEHGGPL